MAWTDIAIVADHPNAPIDDASLLSVMARSGIEKAWIFGGGAATTNDFDTANARALDLSGKYPNQFVPIGVVNPFHVEARIPSLLRNGMKGFRVLTNWGNGISLNNVRELLVPLAAMMRDAGLPLIRSRASRR